MSILLSPENLILGHHHTSLPSPTPHRQRHTRDIVGSKEIFLFFHDLTEEKDRLSPIILLKDFLTVLCLTDDFYCPDFTTRRAYLVEVVLGSFDSARKYAVFRCGKIIFHKVTHSLIGWNKLTHAVFGLLDDTRPVEESPTNDRSANDDSEDPVPCDAIAALRFRKKYGGNKETQECTNHPYPRQP